LGPHDAVDILERMSPKLALQIGAVLAIVFGLGLALLPAQMLAGFGLATPNEALVVSRDVGVTLVGVGVINWLARDATGPRSAGSSSAISSSRSSSSS